MSYWHTGAPNSGDSFGWLGRLADRRYDPATHNVIVNIGNSQSLAVRSGKHSPLVFNDPNTFRRDGTDAEKQALAALSQERATSNSTLDFLAATARNATDSSDFVRRTSAQYRTPADYGIGGFGGGLQHVAALIAAGTATRLYYVAYQGNSFDTHVQQGRSAQPPADVHRRRRARLP
jgi:hypothetical protein